MTLRTQVEIVVQRLVDTGTLRDNQSFRDEAIDAIEKVAREFAEKAVRRYHLYRGTTYECTTEQLILSALRDAEKI